jgi:exodeoxyribonuclease-3
MKLISWNVNGVRASLKKGALQGLLADTAPDLLCLQETKARAEDVDHDFTGYHAVWNAAEKRGYSGTAMLSKAEPLSTQRGIGIAKHDDEGRVVTAEFADLYVVTVYTPNAKRDLSRLDYRTEEWDVDFLAYCRELEQTKPVIFCGDLNVAHGEDDLANPKANKKTHGFTPEERAGFDNIVAAGFIDSFREFHQGNGHYTWWAQWGGARQRNVGWRIDYVCLSAALRPRLKSAAILKDVMGSDHCPVQIELTEP